MKKTLLTISTFCFLLIGAQAQNAGDLDLNFGISGYAMTDPLANTGELYWDLITLSDDKIIKVGFTSNGDDTDILVAKFLEDGSPDLTFGVDGFAVIDLSIGGDEDARGVYELSDGKLLITGYTLGVGSLDGYIMRLNSDGTIDDSFGEANGHTNFNTGDNFLAYGKEIRVIGNEIFVGASALVDGQSDLCVFNFTQAGALDVSFSSSGVATMDINGESDEIFAMDITSNGSFILGGISDSAGYQLGVVAKLSQFGTPTLFGTDGSYTFDLGSGLNEVNDLLVDENDKIVLTGDYGLYPDVNGYVTRLNSDGTLDDSFSTDGTIESDPGVSTAVFFRSIQETSDGGIIAIGNTDGASQEIYAMMLTNTGSLNGDFGGNGDVNIPFSVATVSVATMGGALQSDGAIIIGGYLTSQDFVGENMFMVRLYPLTATSVDELVMQTVSVYPNPVSDQFTIQMENIKQVQLISISGQVIRTWGAQAKYYIPEGLTPGVYLLKIEGDKAIGSARIIIN